MASGLWASPALSHETKAHLNAATASQATPAATPSLSDRGELVPTPLPFNFGGAFELIDQDGVTRTDKDFRGSFMLVFFGYVQCQSICPIALRRAALALDVLGPEAERIQPIAITIDPENDTPEALRAYVKTIHPRLIGLTGGVEPLKRAAAAYGVDTRLIGAAPNGAPVYAHGSFLFLMAPDGHFLTLLPPTLDAAAIAKTLTKYLRRHPNKKAPAKGQGFSLYAQF
ncbi:MAG: SCO family protein [Alphaproteobacteria bacterium]|nr:SCO family protein [Alphaproteobacteria bacterium]